MQYSASAAAPPLPGGCCCCPAHSHLQQTCIPTPLPFSQLPETCTAPTQPQCHTPDSRVNPPTHPGAASRLIPAPATNPCYTNTVASSPPTHPALLGSTCDAMVPLFSQCLPRLLTPTYPLPARAKPAAALPLQVTVPSLTRNAMVSLLYQRFLELYRVLQRTAFLQLLLLQQRLCFNLGLTAAQSCCCCGRCAAAGCCPWGCCRWHFRHELSLSLCCYLLRCLVVLQ